MYQESENVEATVINVHHARGNLDASCFFNDGISKVDFVLVYTEKTDKPNSNDNKMKAFRKKFKSNLIKTGLHLEEEIIKIEKKDIHHIKIHAPWEVLCYYAEDLSFRAPLQAHPHPITNWSAAVLEMFKIPNIMDQDVPNQPTDYYTCQFKISKIDKFLGSDDHLNFFTSTQRSAAVWEILSTTVYGRRKKAEIGIERMIDEKIVSDAFPLHDGPYHMPQEPYNPENLNMRQILYKYWARWGCWYKYQPLDHIRFYFGEKVAIYFAWLGFYTGWLLPAAVVGLLVFLSGAFNISANPIAKHICESGTDYKMCPVCDEDIGCEFWYLSDICIYSEISYLFDHPGTVFYAVFVSFWAISFLEYWKRKNVNLAHHWDVLGFEEEEERPRPAYAAKATEMETNPITGIKEPFFPPKKRIPRILSGMVIIVLMICLVLVFIIAVIMYRVLVSIPLFKSEELRPRAAIIASISAAIVNLIFIMLLGKVYERLAFSLTQWEMHRTQTDFEDQLIFKVFLFQFVNFYSSIFYIAFFKGRFVGYPGHYKRFFGLRQEECSNGGCLMELAQQLAVIMIGKQIINNFQEMIIPRIKTRLHRFKIRTKGSNLSLEKTGDFSLIRHEGLFDEYLEMILQFGFITIFVAAFPLAPLFALLNNWVEIRLDGQKYVMQTRRPVAERAEDIGVWFSILKTLAHLAVISNAFLIAFTSEFLPKMLYQYTHSYELKGYTNFTLAYSPNGTISEECRYFAFRDKEGHYTIFFWRLLASRLSFVIIFEHIVFSTFKLIDFAVPDVPESLEQKIKRERYLAKQALADTDTMFKFSNRDEEDGMEATPTGATSANKAL
ncbi:anoctamin-7 isoform X1 [Octopus vulgaris]|uniref:Anoctamin n=1 Tax=Octopus vulgaris TaxID=6645 RepID=A0AA36BWG7_OCTVU|nr:anoctamin-7 isoform X1 [Octopus vulgaris]